MAGVPWVAELGLISLGVLSAAQGVTNSQTLGNDIVIQPSSTQSVVIGDNARARDGIGGNQNVVTIGHFSLSENSPGSVVTGESAFAQNAARSTAVGSSAEVTSADSIAHGNRSIVSAEQSTAVGARSQIGSLSPNSAAFGYFAFLDDNAPRTAVVGVDTWGKGSDNAFFGYRVNFAFGSEGGTGSGVVLVGASTSIDLASGANNSIGLGHWAQVRGDGVFQIGDNNSAGGSGSGLNDITTIIINDGDEVVTVMNPMTFEGVVTVETDLLIGSGSMDGSLLLQRNSPGSSGFFRAQRNGGGDYSVEMDGFSNNLAAWSVSHSGSKIRMVVGSGGSPIGGKSGFVNGSNEGLLVDNSTGQWSLANLVLLGSFSQALQNVAVSSTLARTVSAVVQTAAGITTTLWASPEIGDTISIRNAGGGADNTIDGNGATIDGAASIALTNGASTTLVYNGTEWVIF